MHDCSLAGQHRLLTAAGAVGSLPGAVAYQDLQQKMTCRRALGRQRACGSCWVGTAELLTRKAMLVYLVDLQQHLLHLRVHLLGRFLCTAAGAAPAELEPLALHLHSATADMHNSSVGCRPRTYAGAMGV